MEGGLVSGSAVAGRCPAQVNLALAIEYKTSLSPLSSTNARSRLFSFARSSLGRPNSTFDGIHKSLPPSETLFAVLTIRPASSTICR